MGSFPQFQNCSYLANMSGVSINMSQTNLFKPLKVGNVTLKNRLAYAPSTRMRTDPNHVPTDSMLEYYRRRAENNGGLLVVEATAPHPSMGLYPGSPVLYTDAQVKAFKQIVDAVHKEGSFIGIQLWDIGRGSYPALLKAAGYSYHGPSAIYFDAASEQAAIEAGNPIKAMTIEEIEQTVVHFVEGATRAIKECGFDFVEIHGAHGYLVDSFLQESANKRTDRYGGSIENRARLALEIVDGCIEAVGAEHVAIRLSPYAVFQGSDGINARINPIVTWGYLLSEFQRRAEQGKKLAYVSVVEPRISGIEENKLAPQEDLSWIGQIWKGIIFTTGNYLDKRYIDLLPSVVNRDDRTIIGASRYYTSNPDLADRLKRGLELTPYKRDTFYIPHSNVGYLNAVKYGEKEDHSKDDVPVHPLA